VLRE
jgi:hypothetical protein